MNRTFRITLCASLLAAALAVPAGAVIQSWATCQAGGGLPDGGVGMPNSDCLSEGSIVVDSTPYATRAAGVAWNLGLTFQVTGDVQHGGHVETAIGGGFQALVGALASPPVAVGSIPLLVTGDFATTLGGTPPLSSSSGEITLEAARLRFDDRAVLREDTSLAFDVSNPPAGNVLELPYEFLFSGSLTPFLQLGGSSICVTSAGSPSSSSCSLQLSFGAELDQDAFDQQMGANTFPLDEYFIIIPLPEPAAGSMLGSGGLALLALGRRRARGPFRSRL
jgi:hypothetical protein